MKENVWNNKYYCVLLPFSVWYLHNNYYYTIPYDQKILYINNEMLVEVMWNIILASIYWQIIKENKIIQYHNHNNKEFMQYN